MCPEQTSHQLSRDCFTEAKDADNLDYEEIFTFGKNGSDYITVYKQRGFRPQPE